MAAIVVERTHGPQGAALLRNMFRLRHRVFRERLDWEVPSHNGLERDEYDDLDPVYIVSLSPDGRANGCARLLPTTACYMLQSTFSSLLRGEPAPKHTHVWELSRFAVTAEPTRGQGALGCGETTLLLMQRAYEFAIEHGIRSYVAVTNLAFERLLKKAGLPMRRFGDGVARRVGKNKAVAVWIDINEQCRRAVYNDLDQALERKAA